ncbi:hypothetical protein REL63_004354 [Salmonella enterica]|nr:hypothetical protein [Salmonella enterica]
MTTITRERLLKIQSWRETYGAGSNVMLPAEEAEELARIALASLEAKPIGAFHIADQQVSGTTDYIKDGEWPIDNGVIEVYATPPASEREQIRREHAEWSEPKDGEPWLHIKEQTAPVVPPAIEPDYKVIKSILPTANPDEYACCIAADMWNACRSAMLNGGKL